MQITILGSGSAYGSPYAGNHYGKLDKNNPKNIRLRPSTYFFDNNESFLVECGPDFREQMCRYNIKKIDNIFISHGHADHIMGIWELIRFSKMMGTPINLWGNQETINEIRERFSFMFNSDFKEMGTGSVVLNVVEPYKPLKLPKSNFELIPLEFVHKKQLILGFKCKSMVFTPDVAEIPAETMKYLRNLDLWIFECDADEDMKKGHNYLGQALKWIDEYKPKKCILNHLGITMDYNTISKKLPINTSLAYDGMLINL